MYFRVHISSPYFQACNFKYKLKKIYACQSVHYKVSTVKRRIPSIHSRVYTSRCSLSSTLWVWMSKHTILSTYFFGCTFKNKLKSVHFKVLTIKYTILNTHSNVCTFSLHYEEHILNYTLGICASSSHLKMYHYNDTFQSIHFHIQPWKKKTSGPVSAVSEQTWTCLTCIQTSHKQLIRLWSSLMYS